MPLANFPSSPDRVTFRHSLSAAEIALLVADTKLRVLQTSDIVDPKTWDLLNSVFFAKRPDVELRVFSFGSKTCDLSFTSHLTNVRRFSADCLIKATGIEHLARLIDVESLAIGIRDLETFDFLREVQHSKLRRLSLMATLSKKPDLKVIEHFPLLDTIYIEGQSKNIEVLENLSLLEDLTLRSITVPSLSFLRGLPKLWSLDIKLGGIKNLNHLSGLPGLKYLELWQIKGLSDLGVIAELPGLQYLYLQALKNVERLPSLSTLTALRRLYLENLKGLTDLSFLETAPMLEELVHVAAQGREPSQYANILRKGALKRLRVGFGSKRKNDELHAMMEAAGVDEFQFEEFQFV